MTANIRIRENRKIPHNCDPYYDFKHPDAATPGDLWECPHGHIWILSLWRSVVTRGPRSTETSTRSDSGVHDAHSPELSALRGLDSSS